MRFPMMPYKLETVSIGMRTRDARKKLGLTPTELASRLGLSIHAIKKIEPREANAQFVKPDTLARALNSSPDAF